MKRLFLLLILSASAVVHATAGNAPSLSGQWIVHLNIIGREADVPCTFTQQDTELTGSCKSGEVSGTIRGTVDGSNVNWQLTRPLDEQGGTLVFSGTIGSDGKMTGTVDVPAYTVGGLFTAMTAGASAQPQSASAVTDAAASGTPSLNGQWTIHLSVVGNENDQNCTLTQKGGELTGDCGAGATAGTMSGTVDGKQVKWQLKTQYEGGPLVIGFTGTIVSDGKITGTVDIPAYSVGGEFTATKAGGSAQPEGVTGVPGRYDLAPTSPE